MMDHAIVHVWTVDPNDSAPLCGAPAVDTHPECRDHGAYPSVSSTTAACPRCRRPICLSCRLTMAADRDLRIGGGKLGGGNRRVISV